MVYPYNVIWQLFQEKKTKVKRFACSKGCQGLRKKVKAQLGHAGLYFCEKQTHMWRFLLRFLKLVPPTHKKCVTFKVCCLWVAYNGETQVDGDQSMEGNIYFDFFIFHSKLH